MTEILCIHNYLSCYLSKVSTCRQFASLKIKNQHLDWNNWHNFVGARVDGLQKCYQLNDDENTTVITLLDSEDTDKEHEILFFKRMDCHEITLEELVLSDNAKLIPYEKKPCLKMEVYGDSVSAGEVSEAVDYVGKVDPVHDGHFFKQLLLIFMDVRKKVRR